MGVSAADAVIPACAAVGIAFALWQWFLVFRVKVSAYASVAPRAGINGGGGGRPVFRPESEIDDDEDVAIGGYGEDEEGEGDGAAAVARCAEIQSAISVGANSFLFTQYKYLAAFTAVFAVVIFLFLGSVHRFSTDSQPCQYTKGKTCKPALANAVFSTIAFLLGAVTSVVSGFLGMRIATAANARTTLEARRGIGAAFATAFRSGAVIGFLLASLGLLVLYIAIKVFGVYYGDDWEGLYESITGYGLGGSSMALFGRVGGGIYTKAADVGADLVGKVIADNVGDNVGDIAGMGSDLFGSYAESTCAALFIASISSFGAEHNFAAVSYPLLISSAGLIVCLVTTLFGTTFYKVKTVHGVAPALKLQLVISTVLMTVGILVVTFLALPSKFTMFDFGEVKQVKNWHLFFCVTIGLWAGLAIGFTTEYFTSNAYSPVREVADSCRTGAATNVIFGLALGYKSVIVPVFAIAVSIYVSFTLASIYGIAVAALGMLSTVATGLAIDAYGPISDNAGGIAEMAGMSHRIRSAALVSLALFGAFVSRSGMAVINVVSPKVFVGLVVGAMLPYWFSAMTMRSVGSAALRMVEEVRRQFATIPGLMEGRAEPDYASCVRISTDASLREMMPPGALVLLAPLVAGTFFGVQTLAGLLAGALVSGVQAGASDHAKKLGPKGSDAHKAAVIGDTIGDPLKDTSGPSLNILIKLMAVESLVFAPFFAAHGGLIFK
uniref:H(+)-exporting diphosphatase n=1 Tax=Leersia perrieri TaxID=77586 RepID=A0A0D9V0G9_9ORYZ